MIGKAFCELLEYKITAALQNLETVDGFTFDFNKKRLLIELS